MTPLNEQDRYIARLQDEIQRLRKRLGWVPAMFMTPKESAQPATTEPHLHIYACTDPEALGIDPTSNAIKAASPAPELDDELDEDGVPYKGASSRSASLPYAGCAVEMCFNRAELPSEYCKEHKAAEPLKVGDWISAGELGEEREQIAWIGTAHMNDTRLIARFVSGGSRALDRLRKVAPPQSS